MRRVLQVIAFLVLAALVAGALVSSATSAAGRQGYTTGPSGTTGPTGTVTPRPTGTPSPFPGGGGHARKLTVKFKILRGATAQRLRVRVRVNRKANVRLKVLKGRKRVGGKRLRFGRKGKKTTKVRLRSGRLGAKRPVKLTVTARARAGAKQSRLVKHKTKLT
jgi:hypothetical protein